MWEEYAIWGGYALVGLKMVLDIPFLRKRIITDTNMLNVFSTAKKSIEESNQIKINVSEQISNIKKQVVNIDETVTEAIDDMNQAVLEFQESEIYQKMLIGLSELDELHQTLQNKDATIEMLGRELKETHLALQEIKNLLTKE